MKVRQTRRDTEKVTAYVEPALKTAFQELARLHETTVASEVKLAMEQRLERLGYEITP